jgi:hypothetical protein
MSPLLFHLPDSGPIFLCSAGHRSGTGKWRVDDAMIERIKLVVCGVLLSLFVATSAVAQEPGWSWQVIAVGQLRREIDNTPIYRRPYRPFHFYGNTVRRQYYRGTTLPAPVSFESLWGRRTR